MLEKFSSKKHKHLLNNLPFGYASSGVYLDFTGYVLERNGEKNIAVQDVAYPNTFPYLYLPKKKQNWINSFILLVTKKQLNILRNYVEIIKSFSLREEFYYKTKDFIKMSGKKWSGFRSRVRQFEKNYKYKITNNYNKSHIEKFAKNWLKTQKEKTVSFWEGYNFFRYCLKNHRKYNIKNIFVEVDGKLAGLAMGVKFNDNNWIGLHLKVDYKYKGLSRFLYKKRAELFSDCDFFTLGDVCAGDRGIERFKKELNPYKKVEHFYVITGNPRKH